MITTITLTRQIFSQFGENNSIRDIKKVVDNAEAIKKRTEHISKLSNNDLARKIKDAAKNIKESYDEYRKQKIKPDDCTRIIHEQANVILECEEEYKKQINNAFL
jgi:hypothetical protein